MSDESIPSNDAGASENRLPEKDIPLTSSDETRSDGAVPAWPAIAIPQGQTQIPGQIPGGPGAGRAGALSAVQLKKKKTRSKRQASQRNLLLFWSIYLLISWTLLTKLQIRTDLNMVRGMVLAAMVGLTVLWPVYRLSQEMVFSASTDPISQPLTGGRLSRRIAREIWLDWLCLILVFQAVLWPLRIHAGWSVDQTLWLGAAMSIWSLLSGAIIAWGCRWNCRTHRSLAMLGCLAVLLGEPMAIWLINLPNRSLPIGWHLVLSPVEVVWAMAQPPLDWSPLPWNSRIMAVGVVAVVGWLLLFVVPLPDNTSA